MQKACSVFFFLVNLIIVNRHKPFQKANSYEARLPDFHNIMVIAKKKSKKKVCRNLSLNMSKE